jgi:hypothetical protein
MNVLMTLYQINFFSYLNQKYSKMSNFNAFITTWPVEIYHKKAGPNTEQISLGKNLV